MKPLQLSPGDGDGGAEPYSCSQNGNRSAGQRQVLDTIPSLTWAAASSVSCLGLSGHGEHRQGQKWGVGQEAPVPTGAADLLLLQYLGEDQQGPHPLLSVGTLSVWALSLTSSGCHCVGVSHKDFLVSCWKACVLSSASLQGSKVLKDRQCGSQGRALWGGLRGPGPAILCCLILDKLIVISVFFPIFH